MSICLLSPYAFTNACMGRDQNELLLIIGYGLLGCGVSSSSSSKRFLKELKKTLLKVRPTLLRSSTKFPNHRGIKILVLDFLLKFSITDFALIS